MPQWKKSKKNAESRCAPVSVTQLIQLLQDAARQKIVDLDFENLLNLKLGNTNRDFTTFSWIEPKFMKIQIKLRSTLETVFQYR